MKSYAHDGKKRQLTDNWGKLNMNLLSHDSEPILYKIIRRWHLDLKLLTVIAITEALPSEMAHEHNPALGRQ